MSGGIHHHLHAGHMASALINGNVLVAGGFKHDEDPTNATEIYDRSIGIWTIVSGISYA